MDEWLEEQLAEIKTKLGLIEEQLGVLKQMVEDLSNELLYDGCE